MAHTNVELNEKSHAQTLSQIECFENDSLRRDTRFTENREPVNFAFSADEHRIFLYFFFLALHYTSLHRAFVSSLDLDALYSFTLSVSFVGASKQTTAALYLAGVLKKRRGKQPAAAGPER